MPGWRPGPCPSAVTEGQHQGVDPRSILVYSVHKKLSPTGDIGRANPVIKTLQFPGQGSIWQLMFVSRNPGKAGLRWLLVQVTLVIPFEPGPHADSRTAGGGGWGGGEAAANGNWRVSESV